MSEKIIRKSLDQKIVMKTECGETFIERTENYDAIIESNKIEQNAFKSGDLLNNTQKHRRKVAEIPANLYFDLLRKFGSPQQNWKKWKQWLSDPENKFFRTDSGKL